MEPFHPCMLVLALAAAAACPAVPPGGLAALSAQAAWIGPSAGPARLLLPTPTLRFEAHARAASRDARDLRVEALRGPGGTRRHDVR